jgi:hypothetical protein
MSSEASPSMKNPSADALDMSNEALYRLMHEGEHADLALPDVSSHQNLSPLACQLRNIHAAVDKADGLEAILVRAKHRKPHWLFKTMVEVGLAVLS